MEKHEFSERKELLVWTHEPKEVYCMLLENIFTFTSIILICSNFPPLRAMIHCCKISLFK